MNTKEPSEDSSTPETNSAQRVEKEIKSGNPAIPGNDEISPGVSWRIARTPCYPSDPPAIAHFLRRGNWLISKFRMSGSDLARDTIDLVAAAIDALAGVVEHAIFEVELVDAARRRAGSFSPKTSCRLRVNKVDMLYDMAVVSPLWTVWRLR
jgi:hypothetical protein